MMCDFKKNTENVGLKIHPDKTKILSNQSANKRKEVEISNIKLEILLALESAVYLGQQLRFSKRKQQRSKIESEPPGLRSADTNKS